MSMQINEGIIDFDEKIPVGDITFKIGNEKYFFHGQTLDKKTPAGVGRYHGPFGMYQGPFVNGLPYGFGIYFSSDGYVYIGNFDYGRVHGKGKMIKKNDVIEGKWFHNNYYGSKNNYIETKFPKI